MPNTIDKVRVHNALVDLVATGPFYRVTNESTTNHMMDIDEAVDTPVSPGSLWANEVRSECAHDPRHMRDLKRDRQQWTWMVIAKFSREVTSYRAEEAWLNSPPIVPRDTQFRQATIELESVNYEHPTKQQSHSGSIIQFRFNVRLSRR